MIDSRTNGPALCAVFQTVRPDTTTSAAEAPRGPNRSAAQMSAGKTTYGTSRWDGNLREQHEDHQQGDGLEGLAAAESAGSPAPPMTAGAA